MDGGGVVLVDLLLDGHPLLVDEDPRAELEGGLPLGGGLHSLYDQASRVHHAISGCHPHRFGKLGAGSLPLSAKDRQGRHIQANGRLGQPVKEMGLRCSVDSFNECSGTGC